MLKRCIEQAQGCAEMDITISTNSNQLAPLNDFSASICEEQFLKFYLEPDLVGMLSLSQLTEVLTIPASQILPIPHMKSSVMGVYNWRGEVLWMVDLGHLIGMTSPSRQNFGMSNYRAMVLQLASDFGTQEIGLIVDRIDDIEWCNPNSIEPLPSSFDSKLIPFLRGYWLKPKPETEILVAFDGMAILSAIAT
jgi:positive phototaxis protein PixI